MSAEEALERIRAHNKRQVRVVTTTYVSSDGGGWHTVRWQGAKVPASGLVGFSAEPGETVFAAASSGQLVLISAPELSSPPVEGGHWSDWQEPFTFATGVNRGGIYRRAEFASVSGPMAVSPADLIAEAATVVIDGDGDPSLTTGIFTILHYVYAGWGVVDSEETRFAQVTASWEGTVFDPAQPAGAAPLPPALESLELGVGYDVPPLDALPAPGAPDGGDDGYTFYESGGLVFQGWDSGGLFASAVYPVGVDGIAAPSSLPIRFSVHTGMSPFLDIEHGGDADYVLGPHLAGDAGTLLADYDVALPAGFDNVPVEFDIGSWDLSGQPAAPITIVMRLRLADQVLEVPDPSATLLILDARMGGWSGGLVGFYSTPRWRYWIPS